MSTFFAEPQWQEPGDESELLDFPSPAVRGFNPDGEDTGRGEDAPTLPADWLLARDDEALDREDDSARDTTWYFSDLSGAPGSARAEKKRGRIESWRRWASDSRLDLAGKQYYFYDDEVLSQPTSPISFHLGEVASEDQWFERLNTPSSTDENASAAAESEPAAVPSAMDAPVPEHLSIQEPSEHVDVLDFPEGREITQDGCFGPSPGTKYLDAVEKLPASPAPGAVKPALEQTKVSTPAGTDAGQGRKPMAGLHNKLLNLGSKLSTPIQLASGKHTTPQVMSEVHDEATPLGGSAVHLKVELEARRILAFSSPMVNK